MRVASRPGGWVAGGAAPADRTRGAEFASPCAMIRPMRPRLKRLQRALRPDAARIGATRRHPRGESGDEACRFHRPGRDGSEGLRPGQATAGLDPGADACCVDVGAHVGSVLGRSSGSAGTDAISPTSRCRIWPRGCAGTSRTSMCAARRLRSRRRRVLRPCPCGRSVEWPRLSSAAGRIGAGPQADPCPPGGPRRSSPVGLRSLPDQDRRRGR